MNNIIMDNPIIYHKHNSEKSPFWSILITGFVIFLMGCEEAPLDEYNYFHHRLVIDGKIESGNFARVSITRNIPYYFELDSSNILDYIIRKARVEISDGSNSEVLSLRLDEREFPPYFYQGRFIRGEPGKTYHLNITYTDIEITSTTTIPDLPKIDTAWFEPMDTDPELGTVSVKIVNQPENDVFYRFYTLVYSDSEVFHPCLLPNFESRFFPQEEVVLSLNKGPSSFMKMEDAEFLFNKTDTIAIKICRMDKEQFDFWESYQEEVFGGSNPFTAGNRQVSSNINGGYGNWGGFAVEYYTIYPN